MKIWKNLNLLQWGSLKVRVTLLTLCIFLFGIWSLAIYASRILHEDIERLLGAQQSSTVSYISSEINRDLGERLYSLELVASTIQPEILNNPKTIQEFLNTRVVLQNQFNAGVFAYKLHSNPNLIDLDYNTKEEMLNSIIKENKSMISQPHLLTNSNTLEFEMIVPIRNSEKKIIGCLVGVTNLNKPNFLNHLTKIEYGKKGYYMLEEPKARFIILSSNQNQIMQHLPARGINQVIDHQLEGNEETNIAVDPDGIEMLTSAKKIPLTNWIVVASLPTSEAFAPIQEMKQRVLLTSIILTVFAGGLTWWLLTIQLSPILTAIKTLSNISDKNEYPHEIPISNQDEIGKLINGFNGLLKILIHREKALRESEQRFRNLFEKNSSVMLIIEPNSGEIVEANESAVNYYGYSSQKLTSMSINDINTLPPDQVLAERKKALSEERSYFLFKHKLASGEIRDIEAHVTPIESSGRPLLFSIIHDITERKQLEEKLKSISIRDPLTDVFNRRYIFERLDGVISEYLRADHVFSILIMDLDHFKIINDTYGHQAGDFILVEFSKIIKHHLRPYDLIGRYGGEEFIVILMNTKKEQIVNKVEELLSIVRNTMFEYKTSKIHITFSGGISDSSEFEKNNVSIEKIIESADNRLYSAKKTGRDKIVIS